MLHERLDYAFKKIEELGTLGVTIKADQPVVDGYWVQSFQGQISETSG